MKIAKYVFGYQGKKKNQEKQSGLSLLDDSNNNNEKNPEDNYNRSQMQKYPINEALKILNDSKLKIDDLLPLFPPDEKVQDMKDHLCNCLSDYKIKIESLKTDLDDLSQNAEILRN